MDDPSGFGKIVNFLGTIITKTTNPFTPLLLSNLVVDTFTIMVFLLFRHIWIWIPAIIFWIFTGVMYALFAIKAPHMLSSTEVQKYGMQLSKLGQKDKEITVAEMEVKPSEEPSYELEGEIT